MKKLLSIILCVALALTLSVVAFAGGDDGTTPETPTAPVASESEIGDKVATGGEIGKPLSSNSELVPDVPVDPADDKDAQIEELKKQVAELEEQVKALEAEKATLVTDRDAAKAEAADLNSKIATLNSKVAELEAKNAELQKELDAPHKCTYQVVMWVLVAVVAAAVVAGIVLVVLKKKK